MSYIMEYKLGIIDEDEYKFEARRFNREELDVEHERDFEPEESEDEEWDG